MMNEANIVSRDSGELDGWKFETVAGQNIDSEHDWVCRITTYRQADKSVAVYQGSARYLAVSESAAVEFRYGTAMTNGSAINKYTKANFGFRHIYRPQHPFKRTA